LEQVVTKRTKVLKINCITPNTKVIEMDEKQKNIYEYNGTEMTQNELDEKLKEVKENSRFYTMSDGETTQFEFTGKSFLRQTRGEDSKGIWEAEKIDWELEEKTQKGESKLLSFTSTNKINVVIADSIKAGIKTIWISRTGIGTSTKYSKARVNPSRKPT
jgi:hypothetical protein